jgi:uracil phosphoribosyltransferase
LEQSDTKPSSQRFLKYQSLTVIDHNLARHKLTLMRDRDCTSDRFRRLMRQTGLILCSEATRDLELISKPRPITTPVAQTKGYEREQETLVVIPVLRAGLILAESFSELLPRARTGHMGFFIDPQTNTLQRYLTSIPSAPVTDFFLLDPVIAKGTTITAAVDILLGDVGIDAEHIRIICILAAAPGIEAFYSDEKRAKIRIYAVAIDPEVNEQGYVVPGLGDAGGRLFGIVG